MNCFWLTDAHPSESDSTFITREQGILWMALINFIVVAMGIDRPLVSVLKVVTGSESISNYISWSSKIFSLDDRIDRLKCLRRRRYSSERLVDLIEGSVLAWHISLRWCRKASLWWQSLKGVLIAVACKLVQLFEYVTGIALLRCQPSIGAFTWLSSTTWVP